MQRKSKIILGVIALVMLCVIYVISPFIFRRNQGQTSMVCSVCGATSYITEYYLPFSDFMIYRHEDIGKPYLSEALYKYHLVGERQHEWLLWYTKRGREEGLGSGGNARSGAMSLDVALFIEMLATYHGNTAAQNYARKTLSEGRYGRMIQGILRPSCRTVYDTHSKAEFERYWKEIKPQLDKIERYTAFGI